MLVSSERLSGITLTIVMEPGLKPILIIYNGFIKICMPDTEKVEKFPLAAFLQVKSSAKRVRDSRHSSVY